ncbi:MAG: hypothetical protein NWS63_05405 [Saprospiraceae bacterium]|nr:hypothetical protein [Saprospiraceae bacterium]
MKINLSGTFSLLAFLVLLGLNLVQPIVARGSISIEVVDVDPELIGSSELGAVPDKLPHPLLGEIDPAECEETQKEERHSNTADLISAAFSFSAHLYQLRTAPVCVRAYPAVRKRYLAFHCLRINC